MDEAIIIFKLIVELNPNSAKAYDNLAKIYEHIGEIKLSDEAYKKSIEFEKRDQELYLLLNNGKYEKAKVMVEKIPKETLCDVLFPSSKIGPLYSKTFRSGNIKDAIKICKTWALGNPSEVGPYFSLARVYQKKGDIAEAIKCYEKILQIAPSGRHVSTAKMRLKELQNK